MLLPLPSFATIFFSWSDQLMSKLRCSFWVTNSVMSKYETIHKAIVLKWKDKVFSPSFDSRKLFHKIFKLENYNQKHEISESYIYQL